MAATNFSGPVISAGGFQSPVALGAASTVPVTAGGATVPALTIGNVANFGIFFGSGPPTISAAQGSLYLCTNGSSATTRAYINTNGTTGWTSVTTAT
jgi:hypothetical protein